MEDQDRKRIILTLRWTAIIVTSYLILFGKGRVTDLRLSNILIFIYLFVEYFTHFFPEKMVFKFKIILSAGPLRYVCCFVRNVSFRKNDNRFLSGFFLDHHLCVHQP